MASTRTVAAFVTALLFAVPATAGMTTCRLQYTLQGWSFFYKEYKGGGTVTCENGQTASVRIVSRGGGITFGKSEINDGRGTFSEVVDISEVFGTYVAASASAGATKSAEGQAMTKGEVSLAISGTGRGMELGFAFGSFRIERE